jgi:hypothetical protein
MDCFAALAMTERHGFASRSLSTGARLRDPLARNDGEGYTVIACDKREAFAQGSEATKQSSLFFARRDGLLRCARNDGEAWIASRSLSTSAHSRDPVARNDGEGYTVIACDKREAFAQGSEATKQSILSVVAWIASLRSQ